MNYFQCFKTMALAISCLSEMLDCMPRNFFIITTALGEAISTEVKPLGESVLIQTLFSALYTKLVETAEKDAANRSGEPVALSKSSICTTLSEAICSIDEDNKHTEGIRNLILKAQIYAGSENQIDQDFEMDTLTDSPRASMCEVEFDVDSNDYVSDLICGDLLTTSVGKQSVKVRVCFFLNDHRVIAKQ